MRVIGVIELGQFVALVALLSLFTMALSIALVMAWDYLRNR
jgi:hypothetical protein